MTELFTLGKIYPSDFLKPSEKPRSEPVEMKLILDDNHLVRLEKTAAREVMYGKYWYRSGTNATMKKELKDIVDSIFFVYKTKRSTAHNPIWLDIACNDGTLLSNVPTDKWWKFGVDPADDSFKNDAQNHGQIIQDYFSADVFKKHVTDGIKATIVTSIAMFYDLEDPESFIKDVHEILHNDGLWVMQLSYTPLMLRQMAFDNICHEHIYYYSFRDISHMLSKNGFQVMDCQLNDVNGGSMRLHIMKKTADVTLFATKPYRDVCDFRIESLLKYEIDAMYGEKKISQWQYFFKQINQLKFKVTDFIKAEIADGKTVWGYGASTKGNTLLQYFGLDNTMITAIADRSEQKWGLRTVGTNIPIYSEDEMRKANPDYLLVLPWHFISEFIEREDAYLVAGGKFIVPCPTFEIIGK